MTVRMDEAMVRALPWEGVVDLDQVLRYALPAYGGDTLGQAIATLRAEPSEEEIVTQLAAELRSAPQMLFDEPLRAYFINPEDWDDEDQAEHGDRPIQPRIGNGMHRVAAAVAAGAGQVRVTTRDWKSIDSPFGGELIEVQYRVRGAGSPVVDDAVELAYDWLRSFRLTDDAWVEAATMGSCNAVVDSIYHCPHRLLTRLLEQLELRTVRHGLTLEVVQARATTWDQLEREDET
jgi:hypothetical protein